MRVPLIERTSSHVNATPCKTVIGYGHLFGIAERHFISKIIMRNVVIAAGIYVYTIRAIVIENDIVLASRPMTLDRYSPQRIQIACIITDGVILCIDP